MRQGPHCQPVTSEMSGEEDYDYLFKSTLGKISDFYSILTFLFFV